MKGSAFLRIPSHSCAIIHKEITRIVHTSLSQLTSGGSRISQTGWATTPKEGGTKPLFGKKFLKVHKMKKNGLRVWCSSKILLYLSDYIYHKRSTNRLHIWKKLPKTAENVRILTERATLGSVIVNERRSGYRISHRRRCRPSWGAPTYDFAKCSKKDAWNWKRFGP